MAWNDNHSQLVYYPAEGYTNDTPGAPNAEFTYTIKYAGVVIAQAATVSVQVKNQKPTIDTTFDPSYSVLEDALTPPNDPAPLLIDFQVNDAETPAIDLGVTTTELPTGIVSVSVVHPPGGNAGDRQLQVTPIADQFGDVTITLTVTDANGATTPKTVTVHVLPVNDAPSFTKGAD